MELFERVHQPYLRVEAVEAAVVRHYATVRLTQEFRGRVRGELDDTLLSEIGGPDSLKKTGRLAYLPSRSI